MNFHFAEKMVNTPKFVFSKTLEKSNWTNTTLVNGDLVEEINNLKNRDGKDILVYGGAEFVSNLIKENLIDEYHFIINPTAIGKGLTIFGDTWKIINNFNLSDLKPTNQGKWLTLISQNKYLGNKCKNILYKLRSNNNYDKRTLVKFSGERFK